jgi:hypothetical protein
LDARPRERKIDNEDQRREYLEWLGEMSNRLAPRMPEPNARLEFLKVLDYEAVRAGLDRQILLALVDAASGFSAYSVGTSGARGYMQVMPQWTESLGDGDARKLFDRNVNLRYGAVLMRHMLDKHNGNLYVALGAYRREVIGVTEEKDGVFQEAVTAAARGKWAYRPTGATRRCPAFRWKFGGGVKQVTQPFSRRQRDVYRAAGATRP